MCLSDTVGVVSGQTVSGSARLCGQWSEYSVAANIADDISSDLLEVLGKRGVESAGVRSRGLVQDDSDARLGWAEVTSLWFLSEARGTSGTRKRVLPKVSLHSVIVDIILWIVGSSHDVLTNTKET